jgi:hypothetical protein
VLGPPKIQPCVAAMAAVTVCEAWCVLCGRAGQQVYGHLLELCTGAVLRVWCM